MYKKTIRLVLIFGLLIGCVQISAAQVSRSAVENARYMQQIESELEITKQEYQSLSNSVSGNREKLKEIKKEIISLSDQLNNLDLVAAESEKKILNVMKQITQRKNDMQILAKHIDGKNEILQDLIDLLVEYSKFLYMQKMEYMDQYRVLFADRSLADILQTKKLTEILQDSGLSLAYDVQDISFELDQNKKSLIVKSAKLAELKENLAYEQENLEDQQAAKMRLLEVTKGEEEIYMELLAQSKAQQDFTLSDVNTLRDNLTFLQDKFKEYGEDFNVDDFRGLVNERSRAVFEYSRKSQASDIDFAWPASPSRGISAYFLDSSYKAVFGVPHYAIDIRIPQQTSVRAAEGGIVYRAKDNGMGYSYIILAHGNGYMTVYGHIYDIKVAEGAVVNRGDVIGLSGGMPGTKGAGYMTTGPHLHFEVLQNGKHRDPLDYLSLIQLPFESLPEKYANRLKGERNYETVEAQNPLNEEDLDQFMDSEGSYGYEDEIEIDLEEYIIFTEQ